MIRGSEIEVGTKFVGRVSGRVIAEAVSAATGNEDRFRVQPAEVVAVARLVKTNLPGVSEWIYTDELYETWE